MSAPIGTRHHEGKERVEDGRRVRRFEFEHGAVGSVNVDLAQQLAEYLRYKDGLIHMRDDIDPPDDWEADEDCVREAPWPYPADNWQEDEGDVNDCPKDFPSTLDDAA